MGLCLFFLTNFLWAMFIQGATFIPDSRVDILGKIEHAKRKYRYLVFKLRKQMTNDFLRILLTFVKNSAIICTNKMNQE